MCRKETADWINVAQDRDKWQADVNTAVIFQIA